MHLYQAGTASDQNPIGRGDGGLHPQPCGGGVTMGWVLGRKTNRVVYDEVCALIHCIAIPPPYTHNTYRHKPTRPSLNTIANCFALAA